MKIGIVGIGHVGIAQKLLFEGKCDLTLKDKDGTWDNINKCDVVFVAVPTPTREDWSNDYSIVEDVVSHINGPIICILSTIEIGTTDYLKKKYDKRIVFQPEYIGESVAHPLLPKDSRDFIILGGDREDCAEVVKAYQCVHNASLKIRILTAKEAEFVKYMENRAIAFKVAEVQEGYDLAQKMGVDWNIVREAIYQDDPRMSPYWTFVYPNDRGFHSSCIPKDVYSICNQAERVGYDMEITRKLVERNERWLKQNKQ